VIHELNDDKMEERNCDFAQDGDKVTLSGWRQNGSAFDSKKISIIVNFPFDRHFEW
jgi:hypothetical protein